MTGATFPEMACWTGEAVQDLPIGSGATYNVSSTRNNTADQR